MNENRVSRMLQQFARGHATEHELLCVLIQSAASSSPATLASLLPPRWLNDVRSACINPPHSPDYVLFVDPLGEVLDSTAAADSDTRKENCSRQFWNGSWQWHWYFESLDSRNAA